MPRSIAQPARPARVIEATSQYAKALAEGVTIKVGGSEYSDPLVTFAFPADGEVAAWDRAERAYRRVYVAPSEVKTRASGAETAYIVVIFGRGGAEKVGCHSTVALARRKAAKYLHAAIITGAPAFQAVGFARVSL